jgi:Asp-tRNA(Asn)/Glu-tRNA(Gln) amidotransferase C subunit
MDFLWHEVSDKEKEEIRKEAKRILDDFSEKLEKVKDKAKESVVERPECERKEGQGKESDSSFRKRMFENALNKNDDFIIAEKGKW